MRWTTNGAPAATHSPHLPWVSTHGGGGPAPTVGTGVRGGGIPCDPGTEVGSPREVVGSTVAVAVGDSRLGRRGAGGLLHTLLATATPSTRRGLHRIVSSRGAAKPPRSLGRVAAESAPGAAVPGTAPRSHLAAPSVKALSPLAAP